MSNLQNWDVVIGLEIHAQLQTQTKMFASDENLFTDDPNQHISVITLAYPGALPVVNSKAIELSAKVGLALNCNIRKKSVFARKHYFYPDLPKGYQISQFDEPLCEDGHVEFALGEELKKVRIERAHMEEDAGKSTHKGGYSLIDYNRAGVPLLEIVSAPDMQSPKEAAEYARTIRNILRYLEVCDGNLEEGSMRCDCNISIKPKGNIELGTKVEIKNINSFRFIEKALEYEIERQIATAEAGEEIYQETRLYDSAKNKTFSMRSKEEAMDYRYFPDPDLLAVEMTEKDISEIKKSLPELPRDKANRFQKDYSIPEYDALVLTADKYVADYFESVAKKSKNYKASSNWIMGEFMKKTKESKIPFEESKIESEHLAKLITLIDSGKISGKMGKAVFEEMWSTGSNPEQIVKDKGMEQISDPKKIKELVQSIVDKSPQQLEQYRSGKTKLFGFFVGQVMKESKGQAHPEMVNKILKEILDN